MSILIYGCPTWTLTKRMENMLDSNYTRMLQAILNKSGRQHPTMQQLYGHLPPIKKTIQVRRIRHPGHCWRSGDEFMNDILLWTSSHERAKSGRPARTYKSSVPIQDVALKTYRVQWTTEKGGERGSRRSVLEARHEDVDDEIWDLIIRPRESVYERRWTI